MTQDAGALLKLAEELHTRIDPQRFAQENLVSRDLCERIEKALRQAASQGSAGGEEPMAYWFEHPTFGMELSIDQLSEEGVKRGWVETPLYAHPAQASLKLGDIVEFNANAPYASQWRDVELKVVSLREAPDGSLWVSVIETEDLKAHRGNGYYDGETTDIPAEHLSPRTSAQGSMCSESVTTGSATSPVPSAEGNSRG